MTFEKEKHFFYLTPETNHAITTVLKMFYWQKYKWAGVKEKYATDFNIAMLPYTR